MLFGVGRVGRRDAPLPPPRASCYHGGPRPVNRTRRALVTTILTAFVLGLFAGLAPGPYTTMVAGTALERGFKAGAVLALTPLITDIPPLLFSAFLLEHLGWTALTVLGIVGGAVILVVGVRFLRGHKKGALIAAPPVEGDPQPPRRRQSAQVGHVIVSTLVNPSPWVFWLVVASPLLLRAWNRSATEGLLFVAVLFTTNISTASSLAWIASHSRKLLNPDWQRRALKLVGVALVVGGGLLLWQAAVGNFQALIDQQGVIRSVVEEGIPPGP